MAGYVKFWASRSGRTGRIVLGVVLLVIGLSIGFNTDALVGWVITLFGIIPLVEAALDVTFIGPFFDLPLTNAGIRGEKAVEDPLEEFRALTPDLDEKSRALLALMRFWLFGTFMIVTAAVYSYAWMQTADGDYRLAFDATFPIWGTTAVLCFITYLIYWIYITRIKHTRS